MAEVYDILIDDEMEPKALNGDWEVGESTTQHQKCLLVAAPGNYLQSPSVGVDLYGNINNDEGIETIRKSIQRQFEMDGMKIERLQMRGTDVDVTARY